jgi:hypothetical protein
MESEALAVKSGRGPICGDSESAIDLAGTREFESLRFFINTVAFSPVTNDGSERKPFETVF